MNAKTEMAMASPTTLRTRLTATEMVCQMSVKSTKTATTMATSMLATSMMMETELKIYAMQTHAA
jgi:hypothetical protein